VTTRADLETSLRAKGSSMDREKRVFHDELVAQMWRQEQVSPKDKLEETVTHEDMLQWYHDHIKLFESEPRVRWEELMTSFTLHQDRNEAYRLLAGLGNRVLAGATLADVARNGSEGATARLGGQRDWTHKGSLTSTVLENAIFGLPVGQLSEILMSEEGYHIVRVVERQEFTRKNFLDVQKQIKEGVKNDRLEKRYKEFLQKLRDRYPIWTIFDNSMRPPSNPAQEDDDRYGRR
jgi:PPIC-type PPIASE domain